MATPTVALWLSAPEDEALWRAALASQQVAVVSVPAGGKTSIAALAAEIRIARAAALLVDLPLLARRAISLRSFVAWAKPRWPALRIVARLPSRILASPTEEAWALAQGASALVPGQSARAVRESVVPALAKVADVVGPLELDPVALDSFLRVLATHAEAPHSAAVGAARVADRLLARAGIRLGELGAEMSSHGNIASKDRSYHGRTYRQCFLGAEVFAWLRARLGAEPRLLDAVAAALGDFGFIHHVARDHPLADTGNFYRFDGAAAILDAIDLSRLAAQLREPGGVRIADRAWLGKTYPACFVGSEAVDWLCVRHRLRVGEAEALGQRLVDLEILHHVVDAHGFEDSPYYFRFREDETGAPGGEPP